MIDQERFYEICNLMVLPAFLLVPLVVTDQGELQVVLIRREPTDRFWPNLYHIPGTILRKGDTFASAYGRIIREDLHFPEIIDEPKFVANLTNSTQRGEAVSMIYWLQIGKKTNGDVFNWHNLPKDMIPEHREIVQIAAQHFIGFYP